MKDGLNRIVDGVEERLCWRFTVHGRIDPTYEPADGDRGPLDPDRRRRLLRGETFKRLDPSGCPRAYQGLSWRPAITMPAVATGEIPEPPASASSMEEAPPPRHLENLTLDRVGDALDSVKESRAKLHEPQRVPLPEDDP